MVYTVIVKPRSKMESVEVIDSTTFCIRVNRPPVDGAANERLVELLSKHLGIPKSKISIVSGHHGKKKILKILD